MKRRTKVLGIIIALAVFLASASVPLWLFTRLSNKGTGFTVSDEMKNKFTEQFLSNTEVNKGVTIQILSSQGKAVDNPFDTLISYAVWNNTDEPIVFDNEFYGISVFSPDELTQKWNEVKLSSLIGNDQVVLLPKNENPRPYSTNRRVLVFSDFENANIPENMRFCVFGTGQITGKKYSACTDISRRK